MRYSDTWDYTKVLNDIKAINRSNSQYLVLKRKLFQTYELYYNKNNTIEIRTVKTIVKKWFDSHCIAMSSSEKEYFLETLELSKYKMVKDILDVMFDKLSDNFCNLSCSENMKESCFFDLSYEIIKCSNKFMTFPQTDANVEVFLNGSVLYLQKEISQKDYFNSPIEEIIYDAVLPLAKRYGFNLKREYTVRDKGRTEIRYALDLAVLKGDDLILDIEADGLQYHNNFHAMASDRERDRWLLMRGIPTIRFTSRDIFDDLDNVLIQIEEVFKVVAKWNRD